MIKLITQKKNVEDPCYWEFTKEFYETIEKEFIDHPGDNSRNRNFNIKLYNLIGKNKAIILDIGCGHGEEVEDIIADNHIGIGLDGYPLFEKYSRAWKKYPENFFRCDIGKPFCFIENDNLLYFDAITSWECLEHIKTEDIEQVVKNIDNHSKTGTLLIMSIGYTEENVHRTIKDKKWWLDKFNKIGFIEREMNFGKDLVRDCPSHYFFMIKE